MLRAPEARPCAGAIGPSQQSPHIAGSAFGTRRKAGALERPPVLPQFCQMPCWLPVFWFWIGLLQVARLQADVVGVSSGA